MCKEEGCKIRPYFNKEGEIKALYCSKHKKDNMINVISVTCYEDGCKKIPTFNNECERKALYCSKHKKDNMINVISVTCCEDGCKKIPTFNNECERKALYCSKHKKDNMINVKDITCCEDGCTKQPTFNIDGERKPLYCSKHKKDNMINVISITCCEDECKKIPVFNKEGERKPLYCSKHKKDNMIDIKHKTCSEEECKKIAVFNNEGETKALYFSKHKKDNMIDIKHKTCKSEWCYTYVGKKYDGYCLYCYMNLFPGKPVSRNYKTKEYAVVEFVKTEFAGYNWISDKIVNGGCSKRRPDLLLDLGYQVLIIEIDENQHIDYDCSCQNKRIMELSQDIGHRSIVFIRFNPDDYKMNGINISSCWGQDKNGICCIKKSKQREWDEERLKKLKENIQYWIHPENNTNKTIETIQLFYDI
jgi:hypothetical protein